MLSCADSVLQWLSIAAKPPFEIALVMERILQQLFRIQNITYIYFFASNVIIIFTDYVSVVFRAFNGNILHPSSFSKLPNLMAYLY
jgi:hypothetical protein